MATLVMKFGGSLVIDPERLKRVAGAILTEAQAWERLVVVVSAMLGITDKLSEATDLAIAGNSGGYRASVLEVRARHLALIESLFGENPPLAHDLTAQMDRLLFDVLQNCDFVFAHKEATPRDRDAIMSAGERIIGRIIAAQVRSEGLNAVLVDGPSVIITDDKHQHANPLLDLLDAQVDSVLRPLLDSGIVPLVTGFIAGTRSGAVTTLGRGGSDYTATLLAASLRADEVWIWARVDGVMSADPALFPPARVIPSLTYAEVGELSYFGAHILQLRSVEPLVSRGIPLRVRSLFNPDHGGTMIQHEREPDEIEGQLKAVTAVDGIWVSSQGQSIELGDILQEIRRAVGQTVTGPVVAMQSQLRSTLVFVVPTAEGPAAVTNAAARLLAALSTGKWEIKPVKVVVALGSASGLAPDRTFDPLISTTGPGSRQLLVVAPADVEAAIRELHHALTDQSRWI